MTKNLTKAQAQAAYRRVCKQLGETPLPEVFTQDGRGWPSAPILVKDYEGWTSTTKWAVLWEEGPDEWAVGLAPDPRSFIEPISSYALGVYPA